MITTKDIESAARAIAGQFVETPVVHSRTLSELCASQVLLKLESLQMTGSFKDRGALNRVLALSEEERERGVIAASAGNHAQGVAYHAQRLGIRSKIVMPLGTPLVKVVSSQRYGADVVLHGEAYDEALTLALKLAEEEGLTLIHSFEDPYVIAGQGTIGMELLAHPLCEGLDAIICPIGGGGLIAGIAAYVKENAPSIRIIGVEAASCASMTRALEAGAPVQLDDAATIADGIAVKKVGEMTYKMTERYVDEVVTVEEDEIANSVLLLLEIEKIMVEGAGATALAALVNRKVDLEGKRVLSIVSGGNIDVNVLSRIITRGLSVDGRITQFKIRVRDVPGALAAALEVLRRHAGNVLDVSHHRFDFPAPIGYVDISITLETKGHDHIAEIDRALKEAEYVV